jgi:hypothetical protein
VSGQPDVLAGRYRIAAPLPPIGGVPRDLAVDIVTDAQVEVARFARAGEVPRAFGELAARYQAVRHPCLAPILAWTEPGSDPELDAIVVEQHIEGARLGAGVNLPRRQVLLVGADIADALAALHAAHLMHGAVGSEAVVLDHAGRAILCGAGAKVLQAAALGGAVVDATPSDDLRQLGRLLYVLVCGRAPATPPTPPVELVPDVEPALNGLILSLLSEDPQRPPPPAAAASLRLRDLAGEPVGEVHRAVVLARRPSTPRWSAARPTTDFALATGLAVIALLGVAAAFAVTHDDDDDKKAATIVTVPVGTTGPGITTDTLTLPGTVSTPATFPIVPTFETTATVTVPETTTVFETVTDAGAPFPGTTVFTTAQTTVTFPSGTTATVSVPVTVTVPPG